MKRLEIAVAGCGPAGLAAAFLLRRDGHRVALFDRFEAPRPVGSGIMLQPTGLAVLATMDADGAVLASAARIDRLFGRASPSGAIVLDVRYRALGGKPAFGLGLHRAALFDILNALVDQAGVDFAAGRAIAGHTLGPRPRLQFADGRSAGPFDLIVDALGAGSPLAAMAAPPLAYGALFANLDWPAKAGLDAGALEQRYRRASVMAGVLPIGRVAGRSADQTSFFWSLRGDRLAAWRAAGLDSWKEEVRAVWPAVEALLAQIDHPDRLTFARYVHRMLARPAGNGIVHIGDAWRSSSPQLGQGANMALLDAVALAKALREAPAPADALARFVRLRQRHAKLYQAMSALVTPVYQSDSRVLPFLRDRLAGPASKIWPAREIQVAMVSGLLGDPLRPLSLSRRS
jgi:2-polyprenyl-6-methoxyphenol hydroxylase-like FAD-dependent oxidoreductase